MKVGIFGGVFNPPHLGHPMIAQQILDFTNIDEVWFLPNYGQHPPKPHVAPVVDRLAMTKFLEGPKMKLSTLEVDHTLDGNTINLLPSSVQQHLYIYHGCGLVAGFTTKWGALGRTSIGFRFIFPPQWLCQCANAKI